MRFVRFGKCTVGLSRRPFSFVEGHALVMPGLDRARPGHPSEKRACGTVAWIAGSSPANDEGNARSPTAARLIPPRSLLPTRLHAARRTVRLRSPPLGSALRASPPPDQVRAGSPPLRGGG